MDHEVHKSKKRKRFEATWRDQESLAAQMNPQVPHLPPSCFPSHPSPFRNFHPKNIMEACLHSPFFGGIVPDLQI
jgi:hypothetical protein